MAVQVITGSVVLIHFTLKVEDGVIVNSTHSSGKLVLFRLGDDSLLAPLVEQFFGLYAGGICTVTLPLQAIFSAESSDLI